MKTVAAIYTAPALIETITRLFSEKMPNVRLVNIVDSSLIQDVIRDGKILKPVKKRMMRYYHACEDLNADIIFNTCSSVGDIAEEASKILKTPIIKIDQEMAEIAVKSYTSIAVLATLPTTLGPTIRLIEGTAKKMNKDVTILNGLAIGAFDELIKGNPDKHDELIIKAAKKVTEKADVIVLAQGSMARMEETLSKITGKKVLSSMNSGIERVKRHLEEMN